MERDVAVQRVAQGLGFRDDLADQIVETMKEVQRELEGGMTLPWFILHEDDSVVLLEGVRRYTLSDAFIREADDLGLFATAHSFMGDDFHVKKMQYDKAAARYGFTATGYPEVYALRAETIEIFPIPDAEYQYRWTFYQRQSVLDSNIENAWLKNVPDLMIGKTGLIMAQVLRDAEAVARFQPMVTKWEAWLQREIALRAEANEPVVVGSDQ